MMMRLFSVLGRIFFASFFIVSAWLTFKAFDTNASATQLGKEYAAKMAGLLNLMVYYSEETKMQIVYVLISFFMCLKAYGGFLLLLDRIESVFFLMMYLLMDTPLFCGFYHYNVGEPEFIILLQDFAQNLSFYGALLLFVVMKTKIFEKQLKKKARKSLRNQREL